MTQSTNTHTDRWVFGYGSLMWRPGFAHTAAVPARVIGAHRSLCVYSHVHRGTPERPGLVLGLNHGGSCNGIAFRVAVGAWDDTVAYLREREQVTMVYKEAERPARLLDGSNNVVHTLCFVVDRTHHQYAGELPLDTMARMVEAGHGMSGPNRDYVLNTVAHLDELGVRDRTLHALADRLSD